MQIRQKTKKKSFEYSVYLHLALTEHRFNPHFPLAVIHLSKLKMEKLLFFIMVPFIKSPLHYLCCRLIELSTSHICDSSIYISASAL